MRVKRIFAQPTPDDGFRVLVDRLWPRGLSRDAARVDHWARDLAPSDELRRWFRHRPERFGEFRRRYLAELQDRDEQLTALVRRAGGRPGVSLLFAAKDEEHNNAVVLAEALRAHPGQG